MLMRWAIESPEHIWWFGLLVSMTVAILYTIGKVESSLEKEKNRSCMSD